MQDKKTTKTAGLPKARVRQVLHPYAQQALIEFLADEHVQHHIQDVVANARARINHPDADSTGLGWRERDNVLHRADQLSAMLMRIHVLQVHTL